MIPLYVSSYFDFFFNSGISSNLRSSRSKYTLIGFPHPRAVLLMRCHTAYDMVTRLVLGFHIFV